MSKMKTAPKLLIFAAMIGIPGYLFYHGVQTGKLTKPSTAKTTIPLKVDSLDAQILAVNISKTPRLPLPTSTPLPVCTDGDTTNCTPDSHNEIEVWGWNANIGLLLANGGPQTTKGSLIGKSGTGLTIRRQDDTGIMQADLLTTAQALMTNPNAAGTKFVTIMGDGSAQFFQTLNPKLAKICPDCMTEVIATLGYSRGEDVFLGPAEWKANAQSARGGLAIGVLRDGDWNIAMKWANQNGVPNNPDDTIWDPNALNWVNADSYTKAAEMMVSGYCADMRAKGNLLGNKRHICADGVVTWTPGDVTVAKKRGGLVPLLSTRESAFQMPAVLIGIRRWDRSHKLDIVKIFTAAYQSADQIHAFPEALQRAGEISAKVYGEQNADYWVKYYKGVVEKDATGVPISLGGSYAANLADALQSFGLSGGSNLFAATYTTFGKIVVQQYPKLFPAFPPVNQILDTQYIQSVQASNILPTDNGEGNGYTKTTAKITQVSGRRSYQIQFATGKADILPQSVPELRQLVDDIIITRDIVAIYGHTDNQSWGKDKDSDALNMLLSKSRATAVGDFLQLNGVRNVIRVYAKGDTAPVAENTDAEGRAKNRRVEIVLGTAGE